VSGPPGGTNGAVRPTRAVILAGGLGMRLRPYTTVLPKPLIPVVDQPIVEHIVRRLAAHGVRRIDLCLGHLAGLIQAYAYVYDPRALAALPAEGPCQFPEIVVRLLHAEELVNVFPSDAAWYDIGTIGEHERARTELLAKPELFAT